MRLGGAAALSHRSAAVRVAHPDEVHMRKGDPSADSSRVRTVGKAVRRARRRLDIVEFPEPDAAAWDDVPWFSEALDLHMRRHRDRPRQLWNAIVAAGSLD